MHGTLGAVSELADRLGRRTLELVDIGSESLHEAEIRERVRSLVPAPFRPVFEGDEAYLWARDRRADVPLLVLAGHYDTVPAQENVPGRLADGAVHGCGASDMKGGVAVALELVRDLAGSEPGPVDVALLLFGREELPPSHNPLPALFDACPLVHEADLAILLEPTDLTVQAGCVGTLTARVTFNGVSGHAARPWLADNAIHRAIDGLARVAAHERREATISGLPFFEVVSVTRLEGGMADNVVPTGPWRPSISAIRRTERRPRPKISCARSSPPTRPSRSSGTRLPVPSRSTRRSSSALSHRACRSSRSRPGRTSPTSRRGGYRRSTSGRAPRATRTAATSSSSSRRSSAPTRRSAGWSSSRSSSVRGMPLSPTLRSQETYPFVRLNEAAAARRAEGLEVIDLGMGDPREPTDPAILQALRDGVRERMGYPTSAGLPELREAIATWIESRFGTQVDADRDVIPTLGSKEAIFSFAHVVVDVAGGRDTVVVTEPGYPVPGRGAAFAGARVVELPLLEEHRFLPALEEVSDDVWRRAALVWLNTPNNPTGSVASLSFLEQLAALAQAHGFVLASDEAYSELRFHEPPPSVLQLHDGRTSSRSTRCRSAPR